MTSIVRLPLESAGTSPWDALVAQASAWATAHAVALRDAVVLVPYAQLLPDARRAFARAGGWMPRVETSRTLALAYGPPASVPAGELSFDPTLDALAGTALLRSQAWGVAWARRDPRGFEQASVALVATAQELARAAAALAPEARDAFWAQARVAIAPVGGPGATERLLARVALEWASHAPAPATDRLYAADAAPAAWIVLQAGGPDPLLASLLAAARVPTLVLATDPADDAPFAAATVPPARALCTGFEDEAQCAAAQVLDHVRLGQVPVALVAQDRVLVRRIRALLERRGLRLLDETGWKLSTTRAAALVMSLLQAARADVTTDALLDWLKAGTEDRVGLDALEATCRRRQIGRVAQLRAMQIEGPGARLFAAAEPVLAGLAQAPRQSLAAWLAALATALQASLAWSVLEADDAGRRVLEELHLGPEPANGAWSAGAHQVTMSATAFRNWVDAVLERATFRPTPGPDAPDVVITPLAQALLRPFGAVVLPGADDRHLGAATAPTTLLSDAQAAALGLPTAALRRHAELLAFGHLLALPRLTLMRRQGDGAEPLADSPLVERLGLALAERGLEFAAWCDPRIERPIGATPVHMTAPAAPTLLPARLSASACEALRACPYRFYALYALGLREDDELEREVEKRDYGTWLHAVLYEFHRGRVAPGAADVEVARLMAIARESQAAQGLADADFLPFGASFATFAPRYVRWLHQRDGEGARWLRGEDEVILALADVPGIELRGILDRVDEHGRGASAELELIDYKTGSAQSLRDKVRDPLEDTQLAFYAALMRSRSDLPLSAIYLALDGRKGLEEVPHREVEQSAAALVTGLTHDLRRLRAGAGLPALGAGSTCDHCAARGICRRDHWAEAA